MNLTDLTQDLIISTVKPSISISPPSLALFSRMPRARKSRRSIFSSSGRRCGGMGEPSVGTKVCMPRLKWRHWESGALKVEDSTRRVWDVKLFTTPLKYDPFLNCVSWNHPRNTRSTSFQNGHASRKHQPGQWVVDPPPQWVVTCTSLQALGRVANWGEATTPTSTSTILP